MPLAPLLLVVSLVLGNSDSRSVAQDMTPLADAIATFNADTARDWIGQTQLPLTEAELIAVLRWAAEEEHGSIAISRISDSAPSRGTFVSIRNIIETRQLPDGVSLEKMTGYEPDDATVYEVWSVRLRMTREDGSSFVVSVREQMIGSRVMGESEREVVQRWRKRFAEGVGSMERWELMQQYRAEREDAAAQDHSRAGSER